MQRDSSVDAADTNVSGAATATTSSGSWSVRLDGVFGQAHVDERGDFVFQPQPVASSSSTACPQLRCLTHTADLMVIPEAELVGASLEAEGTSFRVWYCQPDRSGGGQRPVKVQYRLMKTGRFCCDSAAAAGQAVHQLRRGSSWWGRSTPPHLVLIVNPSSGQRRAVTTLDSILLPMLRDAAGLQVTVRLTERPEHATHILQELSLDGVDCIVFVGGDGTAHEGLQGLLARPDWERAIAIPFAAVPTGSGNGLAASCGHWTPVSAAFSLCRGRAVPLDIASVLQVPSSRCYIFLSLVFGFMSNLDIGTEQCRRLGEVRFTLGGLREVLRNRSYPARVAYVKATESTSKDEAPPGAASLAAQKARCCPSSAAPLPEDGFVTAARETQAQAHQATTAPDVAGCAFRVSDVPDGPPLPLLAALGSLPDHVPALADQLFPTWELLPTTRLASFGIYNTQYLALKGRLNPAGLLNGGSADLIYVPGPRTRYEGMQVLLQADEGHYLQLPYVHCVKVRAVMFEPLCTDTWVVLDGEVAPNRTLYLEMHPGLCRVIVAPEFEDASVPRPTPPAGTKPAPSDATNSDAPESVCEPPEMQEGPRKRSVWVSAS